MMFFAFPGKWDGFGAIGPSAPAPDVVCGALASTLGPRRLHNAAAPIPNPARSKKCRRVTALRRSVLTLNGRGFTPYSFVIVSSRFKITLATIVQAASSVAVTSTIGAASMSSRADAVSALNRVSCCA